MTEEEPVFNHDTEVKERVIRKIKRNITNSKKKEMEDKENNTLGQNRVSDIEESTNDNSHFGQFKLNCKLPTLKIEPNSEKEEPKKPLAFNFNPKSTEEAF